MEVVNLNNEKQRGLLVTFELENYGSANEFFVPDGTVSESQLLERQRMSGMPLEYAYKFAKDFKFDYYHENTEKLKDILNGFICEFPKFRDDGRGLYIFSETKGSGKTMLACCVAKEVAKRHDIAVKFVSIPEYIELVKDKSETAKNCVQKIKDASLLILDDVGTQVENKEWITTALFRLIDYRYGQRLPTIFTSNFTMDELKTDERIAERIRAVSAPVKMPEENIRRRLADEKTKKFLQEVLREKAEEKIF